MREPITAGGTRGFKSSSGSLLLNNRFDYYSRLFRENHNRVSEDKGNIKLRTGASQIAHDGGGGIRVLNSDWASGPNFNARIEYSAYLNPFDDGIAKVVTASQPVPLITFNPMSVDTRRDGMNENAGGTYYMYTCMGWESGPTYGKYGSATSIDSPDSYHAYFGRSNSSGTGRTRVPLADAPGEDEPVVSLGFFQHANLYRPNTAPAFQIGNSFAETRLAALTELERATDTANSDSSYTLTVGNGGSQQSVIDSTYLLNDALWDRFFLSTYQDPGEINDATFTPPNARMVRVDEDETVPASAINDFFDLAAAYLAVNGAFNVNSTSVQAWKAALGSMSGLRVDPQTGAMSSSHERVVSHFRAPEGDASSTSEDDTWTGYRELTDVQLTALAEAMVEQVKIRGPFLSLGEFINRRLADDETGYRGALQAAIDSLDYQSGDNNQLSAEATSINYDVGQTFGVTHITGDGNPTGLPPALFIQEAARMHQYTGVSGWVTQGDIIQALGPSLTVRSDTFRIRAYGESVDPLSGEVRSTAWCEAIVQRVPTPVTPGGTDPGQSAYYEPNDAFGRQFKIVSFHWLTSAEI